MFNPGDLCQLSRQISLPPVTDSSNQEPTNQTTESYEFGDRFGEDVRSVAYYLRQYKFNEYDQRYITDLEEAVASRIYFKGFPKPPLRSLIGRNTALKRNDDTNVIIEDQKWFFGNFSEQIGQTDIECQKMWRVGEERADPFEGPIERFQWRVTASYFLCWYTMKGTTELRRLNETSCDNHANCLQTYFGPHNGDIRADDSVPFNCARYSFCPDPCCPIHHMRSYSECWNSPVNPCFEENAPGNQQCSFNMSSNTEFQDIILNRWNVSCKCPKSGYRWSSLYGICVDIDECAENRHNCRTIKEACINLPGSFKCVCRWGYIWNKETKSCEQSSALDTLVLRKNSELEYEEMNTTESFFKRLLNKFSNRSNCIVSHGTLIQLLCTIIFLL
ncbi:hypothetical protein WA026_007672 [Henosepilachna vigintioctopunctata]|uniref:EGF-like domain-containing protein n=1 Tax=Henosepilachna vigintioctopunctata TaxID=420089 RepID=A0AAW1U5X4_9CUCU